jgi:hypothetical protein
MSPPELLADLLMVLHAAFSLFVVLGLVFILTGLLLGWTWTNNPRLRALHHLAATLIVVGRTWFGVPCPFSAAEEQLRAKTSAACILKPDIHRAFHQLAFRGSDPQRFARSTTTVGLAVAAAFVWNIRSQLKRAARMAE